jgi:tetratricopeptide (TPR) repeat protein
VERHHTLRHAVAWSYDLLDDTEKLLLERCSVFVGGFDLESACAVAASGDTDDYRDDYTVLDLLDALVRKSLLVADHSAGRTRYSILETIRQFAEEQLVARGEATEVRAAHARYFAGRETDILALWDSPGQREAYEWFTVELANLRAGFRWAVDHGDLDSAAAIATCGAFLGGVWLGIYEPIAWAEELIEPARVSDHPRLAFLYLLASLCWQPGRIKEALRYSEAGEAVLNSGRWEVPFGIGGFLGGVYLAAGQPERYAEVARIHLAGGREADAVARATYVMALAALGSSDEAVAAASGLIDAAEIVRNPSVLSLALLAFGYAFWEADPVRSLDAVRRGLAIAQDNGDRMSESHLAMSLCRLEAEHGDRLVALDYCTLAVRNYHDAGNTSQLRIVLAILAAFLHRLGHNRSAAVIAGFAVSAFTTATVAELGAAIAHLRDALGDQIYESLAREGAATTTAAMVAHAYDQIGEARAELEQLR